jgi:hypothetical protein
VEQDKPLLSDDQIARLLTDAQNGATIRGFCQHPGFRLYQQALELVLADKKNLWLKGSDEEAKLERIRAQGVQKALEILKQFLLNGNNAARILKENETPAE